MQGIGNNILNSLGGNNGIDTGNLVEQLVEIEKAPKQESIDSERESLKTKLSDYGILRSALATLQDSADQLADEDTFFAKNASFTDSDSLIPTELGSKAPAGTYSFTVGSIAASQSLSSVQFDDLDEVVGKGTMTLRFGAWDGAGSFSADAKKSALTITIDDSNNSLTGLRDAINDADAGVQATIVNNGSGYQLSLRAPSGASNEMEITVAEDDTTPSNTDDTGLSRFTFTSDLGSQMNLDQAGADASLTVNGLTVTRSGNTIDDVIEGFTFEIAKPTAVGEVVSITITEDKTTGEQAIRDFVESYNAFRDIAKQLTGFNEENEEEGIEEGYGSLHRDTAARAILRDIRSLLASSIEGISDTFNALGALGIRTNLDGSLSINEDGFANALEENYDKVQELFTASFNSSVDAVVVTGVGKTARSGSYAVDITQPPERGKLTGSAASVAGTLLTDLTATQNGYLDGAASNADLLANIAAAGANDYDFSLNVDGTTSAAISLTPGSYADNNALAAHIQTQINADATLSGAGKSVTVAHDGTGFVITSDSTGSGSSVSAFTDEGSLAAELGLSGGTSVAGDQSTDHAFNVRVNGTNSGTIYLTAGNYSSYDEVAAEMQSRINADANLQSAGASVSVSWDTDHFVVASQAYGNSSTVSMTAVGANFADLGLDVSIDSAVTATVGKDVKGTIDGVAGFGVGDVLLPDLKSDAYGIRLRIKEDATSATVNYSRGFGGELGARIKAFLEIRGIIATRETNINTDIDELDEDQERLDRRIEAYQARLQQQFLNMQNIINGLSQSGDLLDGLVDRLPFTARNR